MFLSFQDPVGTKTCGSSSFDGQPSWVLLLLPSSIYCQPLSAAYEVENAKPYSNKASFKARSKEENFLEAATPLTLREIGSIVNSSRPASNSKEKQRIKKLDAESSA